MYSSRRNQAGSGRLALVILLVGLGLLTLGWFQRYALYDWARVRGYQPSAQVAQLAEATTMVPDTRRMFYAYHPAVEGKGPFAEHCKAGEKTIILGCYITARGIYIYDVRDARLHGVLEVTAAHEVLHAGYDRLSPWEKKRIAALLDEVYDTVKDERIRDSIKEYQASGADISNELHSILGTEVRDLPDELEKYYTRYFTDRKAVVSFSEAYEGEFSQRKAQVAEYDARAAALKKDIDAGTASLEAQSAKITSEYQRLQALRKAQQIQAYNAGVGPYNRLVNAYNADVVRIRALIQEYNTLIDTRNALVVEQGELMKAIDSRPGTIETQ